MMITPIQCATMHSGLTEQEINEKYGWVIRALSEYGSRCVYDFLEGNSPEPAKHKPFIVGNVRDLLDELKEEITFGLFVEKLNAIASKFYEGASEGMAEAVTVEHVRELYTSETGEGWMVTPVCHGEKGFASWEYQLWLERKLASLSPGVEDGSGWVKVDGTNPELKSMDTNQIVELMLKSSDHNPYTGILSKRDNLIAAIDLAKLCKEFADNGQTEEAMNIPSDQWVMVISELEKSPSNPSRCGG